MDVKEFIKTISAFDHVSEQELDRVAKLARVREVKRGTVVDAQGDPAMRFYILIKGRVAITLDMDFGVSKKSYIVTTIGPGQMFGWSGLVGNPNYTAGGKTLTDCEVVEFKAGGIDAPRTEHKDSFVATTSGVTLGKEWKQYTLNLASQDLTSVIGGFCWIAWGHANPDGLTFYLDDIRYER